MVISNIFFSRPSGDDPIWLICYVSNELEPTSSLRSASYWIILVYSLVFLARTDPWMESQTWHSKYAVLWPISSKKNPPCLNSYLLVLVFLGGQNSTTFKKGMATGASEVLLVNPINFVKFRMQRPEWGYSGYVGCHSNDLPHGGFASFLEGCWSRICEKYHLDWRHGWWLQVPWSFFREKSLLGTPYQYLPTYVAKRKCQELQIIRFCIIFLWVVSNIFYFRLYLGEWSNLTNIFQRVEHQTSFNHIVSSWIMSSVSLAHHGPSWPVFFRFAEMALSKSFDIPDGPRHMMSGAVGGILGSFVAWCVWHESFRKMVGNSLGPSCLTSPVKSPWKRGLGPNKTHYFPMFPMIQGFLFPSLRFAFKNLTTVFFGFLSPKSRSHLRWKQWKLCKFWIIFPQKKSVQKILRWAIPLRWCELPEHTISPSWMRSSGRARNAS